MKEKWAVVRYHYDERNQLVLDNILGIHDIGEPTDIMAIVTNYVNGLGKSSNTHMYRWHNTTGDPWCWEYYYGGCGYSVNTSIYSMLPTKEIKKIISKNS